MKAEKVNELIQAITGMTYMEWRMAQEQIEREFQMKLNRSAITAAEAESVCTRIAVESGGRFE